MRYFLLSAILYTLLTACSSTEERTVPDVNSQLKAVNDETIPNGEGTLAIVHAQLIIGDGETVIEDGCVLISGSQIAAVGTYGDVEIPQGAEIYDATGNTLLPGLIDAHFHLDRMDSLPSLVLSRGTTTLRDPGAWISAYDAERASDLPLPRLFLTGPHIDKFPPAHPHNAYVVADELEARAAVDLFATQGASAIKIYFKASQGMIRAVCEEADERGLPVTAHLEYSDIYQAVSNGLDGLEHITSLGVNLVPAHRAEAYKQALMRDYNARRIGRYEMWQDIDPKGETATDLGTFLAEKGTFVCPTLGAFEYQPTADAVDSLRLAGFNNMMAYSKRLYDLGVSIVVGSHSWVRYAEHGWALQHEMELFEKMGMTPLEIIHAATLLNAHFFRIADRLGSIEVGKTADLLLVHGSPLRGIATLRDVQEVMLNGEWIK